MHADMELPPPRLHGEWSYLIIHQAVCSGLHRDADIELRPPPLLYENGDCLPVEILLELTLGPTSTRSHK